VYGKHPYLRKPSNSLQPLWRYLKYDRLVDLLSTESLFFPRLTQMSDQWEGLLSDRTRAELFRHHYSQYHNAIIAREQIEQYERHREDFFINCWHMNDSESYLMWKAYGDRGCAVQSTFERIQISFDQFEGEILGGVVEYSDIGREQTPVGNVFHAVIRKGLPYRDEREFRLLFWQMGSGNQKIDAGPKGIKIEVELNKLINEIWVSPQIKSSQSEIEMLVEQKKLDCRIRSSGVRQADTVRESEGH